MPNSFALAPWRSPLARALHRNRSKPHHRFFQLATVSPAGFPLNRTVVFRGWLDQTNDLKIITDSRSQKITDLQQQPHGAIAWYFTKTREQFRLRGTIQTVTATDTESEFFAIRQETWATISENGRSQFAWPEPAAVRSANPADFDVPELDRRSPLDSFVLLIFQPHTVDHLQLRGNPQNRHLYERQADHTWQTTEVNP